MRIIDRRGQEPPGERRWRIVTRWISGTLLLLCGLVVLGVEGCAAVEVAAGRARLVEQFLGAPPPQAHEVTIQAPTTASSRPERGVFAARSGGIVRQLPRDPSTSRPR